MRRAGVPFPKGTGFLLSGGRYAILKEWSDLATVDGYQRTIQYLRISVTDRCNLRCVYCMPPEGVPFIPHERILRFEEIEVIVRAAAELGIHKVRLTGGEPLVRLGITDLVRRIAAVPGIDDLSMTTNAILLADYARELKANGLQRVNISLDTLRPERFHAMTRLGRLEDALAGIRAAHEAGLEPVKVNSVVVRGVNDDEVVDLARKSIEGWNVRFIEWMPVGEESCGAGWTAEQVVTSAEIRACIEDVFGPLLPAGMRVGGGPARYYRIDGAAGTIGFISAVSEHFCFQCNRLRLTADGQLRPCLLSDVEVDLRAALRQGAGVPEIRELIVEAIGIKPQRHHLTEQRHPDKRAMFQIGG